MTVVALVSWQWISPFLERYVDEVRGFLPYTNLEARFISMTMGGSIKYVLLDANFVWFLVLSHSFIHSINSKMAIIVFMLKAWFLQTQSLFMCIVIYWVSIHILSGNPSPQNCCEFHSCPWKKSHKKYTETHQPLNTWYLWPRSTHSVLKLQKKKCWSQKDQVYYLLRNDPVESVVTL